MTKIILATNIILRQPKVLGLQIPETEILVPVDVIEELNLRATQRGAPFDRRIDLIEKASLQGTISIINPDAPTYRQYKDLISTRKLSGTDIAIVAIALSLTNKGQQVKIATLDREIWKIASENGIEILSDVEIENLLTNFQPTTTTTTTTTTIQSEIISYENKEKRNFFKGIITGGITTLIATIIYLNIDKVIATINIWGTIIAIIFAGVVLFIFREKSRLSYGVFEFLVGVVAILMLFKPTNFDFSTLNFNLDFNIRLLGGLYIMVRGQDNIVRGIKDTKIGLYLKDKFGIGR